MNILSLLNLIHHPKPIENEIRQFSEWKQERWGGSVTGIDLLKDFVMSHNIASWHEITAEKIEECINSQHTAYFQSVANTVLHQFIAYHNHNYLLTQSECDKVLGMKKKFPQGRKYEKDAILLVKRLKKEKVDGRERTFREVAKMVGRNVSLVHRWFKLPDTMFTQS